MTGRIAITTLLLLSSMPAWAKAGVPTRILVMGDSLTKGYGLNESEAYPALIAQEAKEAGLSCEVVNGGVSGDTSAGGLRRIAWLLRGGAPDILVLALGANDGLRGVDPKSTSENLQGIIDKTRAASPDVKVLIAGMTVPENMGKGYVERFEALFPEISEKNGATLIPFLLEGVAGRDELNQEDRIHPNAQGQRVIAATVWKFLQPLLGAGKE